VEINATTEDFIRGVGEILRNEPKVSDDIFIFNLESKKVNIKANDIDSLLKSLLSKEEIDETAIYDEKSLEILVVYLLD